MGCDAGMEGSTFYMLEDYMFYIPNKTSDVLCTLSLTSEGGFLYH